MNSSEFCLHYANDCCVRLVALQKSPLLVIVLLNPSLILAFAYDVLASSRSLASLPKIQQIELPVL